MEIRYNPEMLIGKIVYFVLLIILPLLTLAACGPTESAERPQGPITIEHPKACIAGDTAVKSLEKYPLVIGDGARNRCKDIDGVVTCKAKSPDTLYTVSGYCEPKPPKVN